VPAGVAIADDDAGARRLVISGERTIGLRGGDLARTMGGGTPGRFAAGTVTRAPVDRVYVELDGEPTVAVAHVVARRSWWRGRVVLAMNAQFLGRYDVAPRGHPNDGRVEVLDVSARMRTRARWQARRRARTGTHLPHPDVRTESTAEWRTSFEQPATVWVDGTRWRSGTTLVLRAEPDALIVYA
jgi:hypothetical protein